MSLSCKERRQPAENSPALKKGSSQGSLAQSYPFSLYLQFPNSWVWGPREAGLGKEVVASFSSDGRSVCRGGTAERWQV